MQQRKVTAEDEAALQGMVARVRQGLHPTANEQLGPSASYVSATTFFNSGQLSPDMLTRVWEATMRKGYSTPLQIYGQSLLEENNPPPAKVRCHGLGYIGRRPRSHTRHNEAPSHTVRISCSDLTLWVGCAEWSNRRARS